MAEAILTKKDARKAFGWVPPSKRGQQGLLNKLKEQGIETKEQIKAYMRTVGMPANSLLSIKLNVQSQQSGPKTKVKQEELGKQQKNNAAQHKKESNKIKNIQTASADKQKQKETAKKLLQVPEKKEARGIQKKQMMGLEQSMTLTMKMPQMRH